MTDVFISYSRKDKGFVQTLHDALKAHDRDTWVDWEGIPLTADWWQEIERGIEGANTFVFVISPNSTSSKVCRQEIDHAVKHNKRLVPIVHREGFEMPLVHEALSKHNWLFFREQDAFDAAFQSLLTAIDTDLEHVRAHTRLLERAIEWDGKSRNDSLLLRGDDLVAAEQWLIQFNNREPRPTELQKTYISKSREFEDSNQRLAEAGQRAKQMVRVGSAVLAVTLCAAAVVSVMTVQAYRQLQEAKVATRLEQEGKNALQQFESSELEALLSAMQNGQELRHLVGDSLSLEKYPTTAPLSTLQTILAKIHEKNQVSIHQSEGYIRDVSFSPNGKQIATTGDDDIARLWSISGKEITEFKGHQEDIRSINFSPSGEQILTASEDGTARSWNLAGKQLVEFRGHQGRVFSASSSPNGQQIATSGDDGTVRLWSLSGKQLAQFEAAMPIVKKTSGLGIRTNWNKKTGLKIVALYEDSAAQKSGLKVGDHILAVDSKSIANVINQEEALKLLQGAAGTRVTLRIARQGHNDFDLAIQRKDFTAKIPIPVYSVSFSPDGKQIATASSDGIARLWNLAGQRLAELKGHKEEVWKVSFSPNGKQIATASSDGTARLWNLSGQQLVEIKGHQGGEVWSVAFSPNGKRIVTTSVDGTARLWDLSGNQLAQFNAYQGSVNSAAFSPDESTLVTVGGDGFARVWNLSGQQSQSFEVYKDTNISSLDFSPNGQKIVTASWNGTTDLWSYSGKKLAKFKGRKGIVNSVSFSPSGNQIATASSDRTVQLWNLSGTQLSELKGHRDSVDSVVFSPDGKQVATASWDGTARLWDLSGKQLTEFKGHQGRVNGVNFSPKNNQIVTVGDDSTIRLWVPSGKETFQFKGHRGRIFGVSFSPDGSQIATAGNDGTARLWDLSGRQLANFRGHQKAVTTVIFSPKGNRLATVSWDGTAKLWTLSGQELATFKDASDVRFSPDGNQIALAGYNGTYSTVKFVMIKDLTLDHLLSEGCEWLRDYLENSSAATESDRQMCGITSKK